MSDIFNKAGGVDVAKSLGYSGMGPVANPEHYGAMLQAEQYKNDPLSGLDTMGTSLATYQKMLGNPQTEMKFNKLTPARPMVQLQQQDLLTGVRAMGGNK